MSAITRRIGDFDVTGWSVSGLETSVVVRRGSFVICFDMGISLPESIYCSHVFISHGHIDHIGSLPLHCRKRELQRLPPATYYMPAALVEPTRKILRLFAEMHGEDGAASLMDPNLVPVTPGQKFELANGRHIEAFATVHRVQSLGYLVYRQVRKRQNDESELLKLPEVAYLGDTAFSVFLPPPKSDLLKVELLITEVTYVDRAEDRGPNNPGFVTRARNYGHTHLAEVALNADLFAEVGHLLLMHFSDRYTPQMIADHLHRTLPPQLRMKTIPMTWAKQALKSPNDRW